MNSLHPHPTSSLHRRSRGSLRRLILTAASLAATSHAAPAHDQATPIRPPAYADPAHVEQGCYISTIAYIARFEREFPAERARSVTVTLPTFDGPHTVALLTWQGRWWARDEYSGVFPLDRSVKPSPDWEELRSRSERVLRQLSRRQLRSGRIEPADRMRLSPALRQREITAAAALLPCRSEMFWVRTPDTELPLLFFQPFPGRIAVYDPAFGTAAADCTPTNVPALVADVAQRLGYRVVAVRSDNAASLPSGSVALR